MRRPITPEALSLLELAAIYLDTKTRTGDHHEAFADTCRWAIKAGYRPAACWVTREMLAAKRPTHCVALRDSTDRGFYLVGVGGVSLSHALDGDLFEGAAPGWRMIEGEALDLYRQWAIAEPGISGENQALFEIREALADVDIGRVIGHHAVHVWADSLSTNNPLPVPRCLDKDIARQKRVEAAQYARATSALEGSRQSPADKVLIERFVEGELSIEDAIDLARERYGL